MKAGSRPVVQNNRASQDRAPFLEGEGTNSDSDTSDEYLSKIVGLVYVSGKLEIVAGAPTFDGCVVVGGDFDLESASPTFKYRGNRHQ